MNYLITKTNNINLITIRKLRNIHIKSNSFCTHSVTILVALLSPVLGTVQQSFTTRERISAYRAPLNHLSVRQPPILKPPSTHPT